MKRQALCLIFIIISSSLTINFSSSTHPFLLITLPGLLFGAALTLPNIFPSFKRNMAEIIFFLAYPAVWILMFSLSMLFQFITTSTSDDTPIIIFGLLSGLAISIIYDYQFGFKNRTIAFMTLIVLSIFSTLISDHFFPSPHDKELNIGKQIAIWQILIGLGIIFNRKRAYHEIL